MFDRYEAGEQAVLVHVNFSDEGEREDLEELKSLVSSAGVNALGVVTTSRSAPSAKLFVGSGKAEEIASQVQMLGADVVIFNHALSPAQERNLERLFQCRVVDRTGLILDIFAQRARTHEGKLQVELAQLRHLSTRLVRGWTHLERQKGGIGLRGPGETHLKLTDGCCGNGSRRFCVGSTRSPSSGNRAVAPVIVMKCRRCHWLVIPTPESLLCSTNLQLPVCMLPISCLQLWIPPCVNW